MKTKNIITALGLCAICLLSSCSDALDMQPISSKNVGNFYKTQTHFEQAIVGVYSNMKSCVLNTTWSYMLTECRSDNCWQGVEYDDGRISRFTETNELGALSSAWSGLYNYILNCNYILTQIGDVEFTDATLKNTIEGEARFARAMYYFDLVQFFRGVPIVEKPISISESKQMTRATEEEVYNFIISELKTAAELLPNKKPSQNGSRLTSYAAKTLLGKVYVYASGYPLNKDYWKEAKSVLGEVVNGISMSGFLPNYGDNYLETNEKKDQTIFGIDCITSTAGYGNQYPTRNAPNAMLVSNTDPLGIPYGGSAWQLFFDYTIVDSIFPEEGDLRREYSVQTEWKDKSGSVITNLPFCKKYRNGSVNSASNWGVDYIVLSFTNAYMLYGEACYHCGDKSTALEVLNNVRGRAGLKPLTSDAIASEADYVTANLKERRAEFCFENDRWGDLVRTDRAYDVMKAFLKNYGLESNLTSKDQYFYPIPLRETNITGLK